MGDSVTVSVPYGKQSRSTFEVRARPPNHAENSRMLGVKRGLPITPMDEKRVHHGHEFSESHALNNTYETPVTINRYDDPVNPNRYEEPETGTSPYDEIVSETGRRMNLERRLSTVSILEEATDKDLIGIRRFKPRVKEPVFVKVMFLKVGEIRTVEEDFKADILVQYRWREKKLDKTYRGKGKSYELQAPGSFWNPQIKIENSISLTENIWYQVSFHKHRFAYVYEKRRIKGRFIEQMELQEFPFDTQSLSITLQSALPDAEVMLQEDSEEVHDINIEAFTDQQEWLLHKNLESTNGKTVVSQRGEKLQHSNLNICCKATRRASYFLWNTVMVMTLVCGLMFSTFSVEISLVQNRLQLSFILLLSTFTFKHSVNSTLPKVPYLTYLDKFIFCELAVQIAVCVWHAVVFQIYRRSREETAQLCDYVALGVLGLFYVIIHVGFCITWAFTVYQKRKLKLELAELTERKNNV